MCILEFAGGQTLEVTPEHRFFSGGEWIPVEDLEAGSILKTKNNDYLVIENKTIIPTFTEVFNIEVLDNENYFVTEEGILVHNGYNQRKPSDTNPNIDHSKTTINPDGSTTYYNYAGEAVTYRNGYPDFSDYAADTQKVPCMNGNYNHNAALANELAGYSSTPEGYVWHHVEDGRTMQLVPDYINNKFPHTGGASGLRNGTLP
jgi:hypothetical protein